EKRLKEYTSPLVVSFDGGSGAGKSLIASKVATSIEATVIHCDDFFNIKIPNEGWDALSLEKRCRLCIEWERLRQEALLPLLARQKAVYHPFYSKNATDRVVKEPAHVILLDGIYSSQWLPEYVHLNV